VNEGREKKWISIEEVDFNRNYSPLWGPSQVLMLGARDIENNKKRKQLYIFRSTIQPSECLQPIYYYYDCNSCSVHHNKLL
jgi:hypothetical protein